MLSFSNRDYNSILDDLKKEIPNLTDKWTDFNDSDIGMVYIKLLAGVSSMLHYYIDKQSSETFIGTAQENKNIESCLELLGYRRQLRVASTSTVTIDIDINVNDEGRLHNNIIIPKHSPFVSGNKNHRCVSVEDAIITPYTTTLDINVIQGEPKSVSYKNSYIQSFMFYLPKDKIADNYFELVIDGYLWERVDNAFLEIEGGKKYSIHRDAYDSHYILFTHDYSKYILSNGSFNINYVVIDSINAPAGSINDTGFIPTTVDGVKYPDTLRVRNKQSFVGGLLDSDVYLDRAKAQRGAKVLNRLVRLEDYKDYVSSYPGVLDADVSDISVKNTTNPKPYQIDIFVIPTGDTTMSKAFKDKLLNDINSKQVSTMQVILKDATIKQVNLDITILVKDYRYLNDMLVNNITQSLYSKFSDVKFNRPLLVEDLVSTIVKDYPQVYTVKINEPLSSMYPNIGECIQVNNISVKGDVFINE